MILATYPILQSLADIIGIVLTILSPIVMPIGNVMVFAVNYLLAYFPPNNLIIYIVVFVIFVVAGVIVNTSPIGNKLRDKFNKFDEKHFKKYTKHIPEEAEDAFETLDKKKKMAKDMAIDKPKNKETKLFTSRDDLVDKEEL